MAPISLAWYVSGRESRRNGFVGSVVRTCDRHLEDSYQLTVVDLDDDPGLARGRGLLATPALEVRTERRTHVIVGDLAHETRLAEELQRLAME